MLVDTARAGAGIPLQTCKSTFYLSHYPGVLASSLSLSLSLSQVPKRTSSAGESRPPSAASLPGDPDEIEEAVNGGAAGGKKSIRWVRSKDGILFVNCLIHLRSAFAEHFKSADRRTLDEKNTNKFWNEISNTSNSADSIVEQNHLDAPRTGLRYTEASNRDRTYPHNPDL